MDLGGAVALVTGGARRVGRGIAEALAAAGSDVFIHYNRSADEAEKTAADLSEMGVRTAIGAADLGDPDSVAGLVESAREALGEVRVLVNSASDFPRDTLRNVTVEGWMRIHAVTLAGPVFLTQAFANALGSDSTGAVVNVTDWKTERAYVQHFSYGVAKGGLDTFTKAAATALAPRIRVNAVALGAILPPPGEGEEYLQRLAESLPLRRAGGVEVVGEAVVALLQNEFITGEIVRVDGGAHLL